MAEWGDLWGELWGSAVSPIETHETDGKARLLFQFQKLPNIEAMAGILAARAQPIEELLTSLFGILDIDKAYGSHLDTIGVILGLPRQGFDDPDYRIRLRAVATILLPNRRTVSGLLEMLRILLNDPETTVLDSNVAFRPNFSTLADPETNVTGTADGTTYNAEADGRNFDGVTDRLDWLSMPNLAITPWTFSAKVNVSSIVVASRIFSSESAASVEALSISIETSGKIRVVHVASGTDLAIESTAVVALNVDTLVTVTSDGTNLASGYKIFLGGAETPLSVSTSATGTRDDTDFSYSLGGRILDDVPNITGVISEAIVWVKELLPVEVLLHSNDGKRNIDYSEGYPKSFHIVIDDLTVEEALALVPFIRLAKPATYQATFLSTPTDAFGFSDGSGVIETTTFGFGDGSGTIPGLGGPFAALILI